MTEHYCPTCRPLPLLDRPLGHVPSSINDAYLSVRVLNILDGLGITTLRELAKLSESEVWSVHGFGGCAWAEIRQMLHLNGLCFGTTRTAT